VIISYITAYLIRFDGIPPQTYLNIMIETIPLVLIFRMISFIIFRLHKSIWTYASVRDLIQILKAVTTSSVIIFIIVMLQDKGHPRSIFIIDWLLLVTGLCGLRFFIRITRPLRQQQNKTNGKRKRVLIVGAGDAGETILREMIYRYKGSYEAVGLIDDDPKKKNKYIHGVAVLGTKKDIPEIVKNKNIDEIIIAIPSSKPAEMRSIVDYCIKSRASYKTIPKISELVDGSIKVSKLREVKLEDLLRREEVVIDTEKIGNYIKGKRVLITGACGSIGSELSRQVAKFDPQELILFEKSENSLFYFDMELSQSYNGLNKFPIIGDICDRQRVREVFAKHRPHIIFHAAAHKHVPLMEINAFEAIKNNVFGTKVLAEEAINFCVERFVMLSTDKAVNPTSFMGVSKRIAEMLITALADKNGTKFMAVRFGNVLGSEGSVIPTFKRQIERGGPVTITHPETKRYFMTIPEAAGLVIEAGFMGQGGEVFILEMGSQVKILDLARDLIRLSGLEPGKDIEIVFTGLRPGEKLYESLFENDEILMKTQHEKIMAVMRTGTNGRNIFQDLDDLQKIVQIQSYDSLLQKIKEIVPAYKQNPAISSADYNYYPSLHPSYNVPINIYNPSS
jgi:FlaA1/EpsC-like NDP-sugar epimerase